MIHFRRFALIVGIGLGAAAALGTSHAALAIPPGPPAHAVAVAPHIPPGPPA